MISDKARKCPKCGCPLTPPAPSTQPPTTDQASTAQVVPDNAGTSVSGGVEPSPTEERAFAASAPSTSPGPAEKQGESSQPPVHSPAQPPAGAQTAPPKGGKGNKRVFLVAGAVAVVAVAAVVAVVAVVFSHSKGSTPDGESDYIKITPEFIKNFHQHTYDYVGPFRDGMAVVIREDMVGYIDSEGKEAIPCQFKYVTDEGGEIGDFPIVRSFSEGLVPVCNFHGESGCSMYALPDNNGDDGIRWGFADKKGKVVIPFQYERVTDFSGGVAAVVLDGETRYIDKTNKDVTDDYISAGTDGSKMLLDERGKIAFLGGPYSGSDGIFRAVTEGELFLKKNGWRPESFVDCDGNVVISLSAYDDARPFSDGLAYVSGNRFNGFINEQGEQVIDCSQYAEVRDFSSGLAAVAPREDSESLHWGFINKEGALVVPCTILVPYWSGTLNDFHEGRCVILSGSDSGEEVYIINEQGERINVRDADGTPVVSLSFEPHYCESEELAFSQGVIVAKCGWNGGWGFIDREGNSTFTQADRP